MPSDTLYTIAPNRDFVSALAGGLIDRYGETPETLSSVLILLPTRRSCRTLRDAFLRLSDGKPLLLPRMRPIGDVDEDDLLLSGGDESAGGAGALGLDAAPVLPEMKRQLLLARLILKREQDASPEQAVLLAAALARFLDQSQTERLSFDRLGALAPAELSDHWQQTLDFLKIVTEAWPAILKENDGMDPAAHRNLLLDSQRALWRADPPAHPVIAAGSTGSLPATADLLATVAGLEQGAVILPGLDRWLDDRAWAAVRADEGHPQFGLARLLEKLGVDRADVQDWTGGRHQPERHDLASHARMALVADALRPASTTDDWARRPLGTDILKRALDGKVRSLPCRDPAEEAQAIALAFRQVLNTPGRTAALVTPDRELGRRVAAEMQRWDVVVDDSAGTPLSATAPAALMILVAEAVTDGLSPALLLGLLKHPLTGLGQDPSATRRQARLLERLALRGPRPAAGIDGLTRRLDTLAQDRFPPTDADLSTARNLIGHLDRALAPLSAAVAADPVDPPVLLRALADACEKVAATDSIPGNARLWAGEAGEALAGFVDELAEAGATLPPVRPVDFAALLKALTGGRAVRPRYGLHPRLAIFGPLEARLHHADLMILGGLNEGTWPPEPPVDPWMSRPMRKQFGLPAPERRIGLSAHDFAQAFCAPQVLITRSEKTGGSPTVPSRWLQKIETLLVGGLSDTEIAETGWRDPTLRRWAAQIDKPARIRTCARPMPKPPVEARPRRLSVTQIEKWLRDPYTIYARYVLGLKPLDPIDADPGAIDRGTILHKVFELFIAEHDGQPLPPDALAKLKARGREEFKRVADSPGVAALWWPRFERAAEAFVAAEAARRHTVRQSLVEAEGRLTLRGPAGPFVLTGMADRIDLLTDGTAEILDYKTGGPPAKAHVDTGFNPQLALEGLMLQRGGFDGIRADITVGALTYWQVSGGKMPLVIRAAGKLPAADLIQEASEGLEQLIRIYDNAEQPYVARPASDYALAFNDYEHLARIREWAVTEAAE